MERLELQRDLAAAFRWTARLNMNEAVSNHFSACLPNSNDSFYVNRAGIHFSRVKVSDLVLVEQSNIEQIKKNPSLVDPTAVNIHGEIHKKVPHVKCILHVHSKYATVFTIGFRCLIILVVWVLKKNQKKWLLAWETNN
jgi:ribulose-5-phosphate 4-epimerase/fuculose-1-phosphate aldolase